MIKSVVETYNALEKRDLRVLRIIEVGHRRYEFVPNELVERWARYRPEDVGESIKRLHYFGLLRRNKAPYLGWKITAAGYDVLAIHTLRARRKIARLSPTPIGVGKESVVYAGETPSGYKVAVKFHRGGVSVFRFEKAFRRKVAKYRHLVEVYEVRLSALAEYFALSKIFEAGGNVPEPVAVNRHVVVMEFIDGVELYRAREVNLEAARRVFDTVKTALGLGIIHGDLSPYNVIVGKDVYIIDWPQWVPAEHPNAGEYLRRDLENMASFFSKRGIELPLEELVPTSRGLLEEFLREVVGRIDKDV